MKIKIIRNIARFMMVISVLFIIGILGGIENGESFLNLLWILPCALSIYISAHMV